jgi:hypothetical protein
LTNQSFYVIIFKVWVMSNGVEFVEPIAVERTLNLSKLTTMTVEVYPCILL